VVSVAKAELIDELPQERLDREAREQREYMEWLKGLRVIPEENRTVEQKRALQHVHLPIARDRFDLDDIGIGRHHGYYFPASPVHEPFASLFAKKPEFALGLIRDLVNHATKGWHQIQLITATAWGRQFPWFFSFRGGSRNSGAIGTFTTGA
jgi:hypothetical protein